MARICSLVMNTVVRDARVIKQANSLAKSGHKVTIVGITDENNLEEKLTLPSGVEIIRVDRKSALGRSLTQQNKWAREAYNKNIHLIAALPVLAYISFIPFVDSVHDKIYMIIDLVAVSAFALISLHIIANFRRLTTAFLTVFFALSRVVLGRKLSDGLRYKVSYYLSRFLPRIAGSDASQRTREFAAQAIEIGRTLSPDVVHCHDVHTLAAGVSLAKHVRCKVIYDAHEIYEELAQSNEHAAQRHRATHASFLPSVDGFITINESIANWYKEHYPSLPTPVVVMNATTRTPPFTYDGRLHTVAGLKAEARILLYQGGFATKRGLELLIESAAYLPSSWTLVMMGWGRYENELRSLASRVNAEARLRRDGVAVRFVPAVPQDELPYWTAGATIGAIPYQNVGLNHWFCTPNKLWEYPNAMVPVLVSPFPELRKLVEAYGYGWLLPEEADPKLVADRIASLTDDEIARARQACAEFVEIENWSKYEDRLLALYEQVLGGPIARVA